MGNSQSSNLATQKNLQTTITKLSRKEEQYYYHAGLHLILARAFKEKKDKSSALLNLRVRNNLLQKREKLIEMRTNLMFMRENLEFSELTGEVIAGMKSALESMKTVAKGQSVDEINQLMDEFNQLTLDTEEVGSALTMDEDLSLEEEFDKLGTELLLEQLNGAAVPVTDPNNNSQQQKLHALVD
jgi:hypothetical protein